MQCSCTVWHRGSCVTVRLGKLVLIRYIRIKKPCYFTASLAKFGFRLTDQHAMVSHGRNHSDTEAREALWHAWSPRQYTFDSVGMTDVEHWLQMQNVDCTYRCRSNLVNASFSSILDAAMDLIWNVGCTFMPYQSLISSVSAPPGLLMLPIINTGK